MSTPDDPSPFDRSYDADSGAAEESGVDFQEARSEGRAPRGKKAPKAGPVEEHRNVKVFVRGRGIDKETGDEIWRLSPANSDDGPQEFQVQIPRDGRASDIRRALGQHLSGTCEVEVIRLGGHVRPTVVYVSRALSSEQKTIRDAEGKILSKWTDDLEHATNLHYEYTALRHAFQVLGDVGQGPGAADRMADIAARARQLVSKEAKKLDLRFTEDQLAKAFEGRSVKGLQDIVAGVEKPSDPQQKVQYVRYRTDYSLREQVNPNSKSEEALLASVINYSLQRALHDHIVASSVTPDGRSLLANAQRLLVEEKALVAAHPGRTSGDLYLKTREFSEMMAGKAIRGVMKTMATVPANKAIDDIENDALKPLGPHGKPFCLHAEHHVKTFKSAHPKATQADKMLCYIQVGVEESRLAAARSVVCQQGVAEMQDAAMAQGRTRDPSKSAPEAKAKNPVKMPDIAGALATGAASFAHEISGM
jgi:hypothetical protein